MNDLWVYFRNGVFLMTLVVLTRTAVGQAAYLPHYRWIPDDGKVAHGGEMDTRSFGDGHHPGTFCGLPAVRETSPKNTELKPRSFSLVKSATLAGYCFTESPMDSMPETGSDAREDEASCCLKNSKRGAFVSLWGFDDTTFDYELKCDKDAVAIDHGSCIAIRFGVTRFTYGLKAVFDQFDDEWDLYRWACTPGGDGSWSKLPIKVEQLNYSLRLYGGPIAWGEIAVTEITVQLSARAPHCAKVAESGFRALVVAR